MPYTSLTPPRRHVKIFSCARKTPCSRTGRSRALYRNKACLNNTRLQRINHFSYPCRVLPTQETFSSYILCNINNHSEISTSNSVPVRLVLLAPLKTNHRNLLQAFTGTRHTTRASALPMRNTRQSRRWRYQLQERFFFINQVAAGAVLSVPYDSSVKARRFLSPRFLRNFIK